MDKKILIVTDERTGCSEFTEYFTIFDLKTMHDPNSVLINKNHDGYLKLKKITNADINNVEEIYSDLFKAYDVIKICFISYSIDKLKRILQLSNKLNFMIIFIHKEPYKRALSKCIAYELTKQCINNNNNNIYADGYSNNVYPFYKNFKIDSDTFSNTYNNYVIKLKELLKFTCSNNLIYIFININKFYEKLSYSNLEKLYSFVNLHLNDDIYQKLFKRIKNYNPVNKNIYVTNLDELEKKFKQPFNIRICKKCKYNII